MGVKQCHVHQQQKNRWVFYCLILSFAFPGLYTGTLRRNYWTPCALSLAWSLGALSVRTIPPGALSGVVQGLGVGCARAGFPLLFCSLFPGAPLWTLGNYIRCECSKNQKNTQQINLHHHTHARHKHAQAQDSKGKGEAPVAGLVFSFPFLPTSLSSCHHT